MVCLAALTATAPIARRSRDSLPQKMSSSTRRSGTAIVFLTAAPKCRTTFWIA